MSCKRMIGLWVVSLSAWFISTKPLILSAYADSCRDMFAYAIDDLNTKYASRDNQLYATQTPVNFVVSSPKHNVQ